MSIQCGKKGVSNCLYFQVGRAIIALNAVPRFNFWQSLNCCCTNNRQKRSQVENFLHFEESPDQFPIEFCLTFGGSFDRYSVRHFGKNKTSAIDTQKILDKHKASNKVIPETDMLALPRISDINDHHDDESNANVEESNLGRSEMLNLENEQHESRVMILSENIGAQALMTEDRKEQEEPR